MPNILLALNDYIRRLARREIRSQAVKARKSLSTHRRDIASPFVTLDASSCRIAALTLAYGLSTTAFPMW